MERQRHGCQRAGSNQQLAGGLPVDAAAIDAGAAVGAEAAAVGAELAVGAAPHKKLTCCFTFMGKKFTVIADAKLAVIRALQKARKSRDVWTVASWAKKRKR